MAVAYGGFADDWLVENVRCGNGSSTNLPRCEPGEAQAVLGPLGAGFVAIALLIAAGGVLLGRSERRSARRSAARASAPATVVERIQHERSFGRVQVMSGSTDLRLRVEPADGQSFEGWIRCSALGAPTAGDVVTVRYDPARPRELFVDGL